MKYLKYQDINCLLWYSLKSLSTGHYTQLHLCSYLATVQLETIQKCFKRCRRSVSGLVHVDAHAVFRVFRWKAAVSDTVEGWEAVTGTPAEVESHWLMLQWAWLSSRSLWRSKRLQSTEWLSLISVRQLQPLEQIQLLAWRSSFSATTPNRLHVGSTHSIKHIFTFAVLITCTLKLCLYSSAGIKSFFMPKGECIHERFMTALPWQ